MPRRIIDGDALWVSEKLSTVPEKFRAEYAWILPLAQNNGCFECSPMLVWRTCYAALRTGWTISDVTEMLNEFEQVKMLFRFQNDGKTYGFFVGVQKEGRLPKASDRNKCAAQWRTGMVPAAQFAAFLDITTERVKTEYGDLISPGYHKRLAETSRDTRPHDDADSDDADDAHADAKDAVMGNGLENDSDNADACFARAAEKGSNHSPSPSSSSPQREKSTSNESPASSAPSNAAAPQKLRAAAEKYAEWWYNLSFANEYAEPAKHPKRWADLWNSDFLELFETYSPEDVLDMMRWSQTKDQQKFFVRPDKLKKNAKIAFTNMERLKKDAKKWEAVVEDFQTNLSCGRSLRQNAEKEEDDDTL